MHIISTADALPPLPTFSQAVVSKGHVYVSGNIGFLSMDPIQLAEGVQGQTRSAFANLSKILAASGSSLNRIVKVNVYLTDMKNDFGGMNQVYMEFFDKSKMPARTCIGVQDLPYGGVVEVECIAETDLAAESAESAT